VARLTGKARQIGRVPRHLVLSGPASVSFFNSGPMKVNTVN
jgi:hypothetical protein